MGFVVGALIGALQFYMLKKISDVVIGGQGKAWPFAVAKLVLYGATVAALLIWFSDSIVAVGAGLATGLFVCGIASFLVHIIKNKRSNTDGSRGK